MTPLCQVLQVLISGTAKIYATAALAKGAPDTKLTATNAQVVAMVEDQGDVIKVSTAVGHDCGEPVIVGMQVTGYVKKGALVPRLADDMRMTFPDATGYIVEAGAPVIDGKLAEPMLAALVGPVAKTVTGLAARALTLLDTNPTWPEMVCEHGAQTEDEYSAWREKHPVKQPPPRDGDLPYIGGPPGRSCDPVAGSMSVNGKKLALKVPDLSTVVQRAKSDYRVDIGFTCGIVRVATSKLKPGKKAITNMDEFGTGVPYDFAAGPLTWPDGSAAGEMTEPIPFDTKQVKQKGDRFCISLSALAEPVCAPGDAVHRLPR